MTNEEVRKNGESLLSEVRGARLTSVQFVLDYLILGFDQKGALTTLVWPHVTSEGTTLTFGTPGYRDRLCGLIAKVVDSVKIATDETIIVTFGDDSRLEMPLRTKSSGERVIFTASKQRLFVW